MPEDAHMLMEGRISAAEYHLGRAEDTGGVPGASDSKPDSRTSSGGRRADSLAQRLAEPEGVPDDLPDYQATTGSANTATTAVGKGDTAHGIASAPASDTVADVSSATAEAAGSSDGETAASPGIDQAATGAATQTTAPFTAQPAALASAGAHRPHVVPGLTLSGTLRFSPPPSSSPTFSGEPRRIHGLVEIDGYVQGDGSIELNGARFMLG